MHIWDNEIEEYINVLQLIYWVSVNIIARNDIVHASIHNYASHSKTALARS